MNEKLNALVRLHKAMQEKLKTASYSEQIQIFTLVPDKWSRMYCSEYLNLVLVLVQLAKVFVTCMNYILISNKNTQM